MNLEIERLQARARGTTLQKVLTENASIPAFVRVLGLFMDEEQEESTKETRRQAREELEKRGVKVRKSEDDFYSAGATRRRRSKSDSSIEKMAKDIADIKEKIAALTESNKVAFSKAAESIQESLKNPSPPGMQATESGLLIPEETSKQVQPPSASAEPPSASAEPPSASAEPPSAEPPSASAEPPPAVIVSTEPTAEKPIPIEPIDKTSPFYDQFANDPVVKPALTLATAFRKNVVERVDPVIAKLVAALDSIGSNNAGITISPQSEIEPDEMKSITEDAVKDALVKALKENPELLQSNSTVSGIVSDVVGGAAKKAATKGAAKAVGKGLLKSALKKIPIVGAIAGLGFAASRAMAGDWTGAAMEAGSGLAGTVPGVGTAASVGIDAALAARDMNVGNGLAGVGESTPESVTPVTPSLREPLTPSKATAITPVTPVSSGQAIIDLTVDNQTIKASVVNNTDKASDPVLQQNIINNNVTTPPKKEGSTISVFNNENTFNRLIAQDFDHPSSYSTFNMG